MLVTLALLAALSAVASNLPQRLAWPLAALALAHGLWLARCEYHKTARSLVIARDAATCIDGTPVDGFAVHWRGPLAFACWRDDQGRRQRLVWWPDTLPGTARRELRLAAAPSSPARTAGSMAT